jgi:hypothetical protein
MSLLQAASLATLAASGVSDTLFRAGGYVTHLAAAGIIESARLTDVVPGLARDVVSPAWWVIATYYLAALIAILSRSAPISRAAGGGVVTAAGLIVLSPGWGAQERIPSASGLRVVFLDVGQGDSTAVLLPGGQAMLVDAGGVATAQSPESPESDTGSFDIGRRVVAPALFALGVRHLETLAITHGDPDHIGGAPAIVRAFRPGVVWEGVPVPRIPGCAASTTSPMQLACAGEPCKQVTTSGSERYEYVFCIRRCRIGNDSGSATRTRSCSTFASVMSRSSCPETSGKARRPPRATRALPHCRLEGSAPRERDVEHTGDALGTSSCGCGLQCREKQPIRSSTSGCRGAVPPPWLRDVLDSRRWRRDSRHGWEDGYLDRLDGETGRVAVSYVGRGVSALAFAPRRGLEAPSYTTQRESPRPGMNPFGELLCGLDLLPLRLELLEVRLLDCSRSLGKPCFEAAEPSQ